MQLSSTALSSTTLSSTALSSMTPVLACALLLACGNKTPEAAEAASTAPGPDAVTQAVPAHDMPAAPVVPDVPDVPEPQPSSLVGMWQSETCDGRDWVRAVSLADDNSWTAKDLVAPCPEGVSCIWAGIVEHSGSWKTAEIAGAAVLVTKASMPDTAPGGVATPTALQIDGEMLKDDKGCSYARVQAMP